MIVGRHPVIGVLGGSGGVGASTFAAVLALLAGDRAGCSLLLDVDVCGGGADVLLGIEDVPGARWSGLRVDGGFLHPDTLFDGLPRAGDCAVLAADVAEIGTAAVGQVLDAARSTAPVVIDLPRGRCPERAAALQRCDLAVLVARCDVSGLVAARSMANAVARVPDVPGPPPDALPAGALPVGVVLRQGDVPAAEAAGLIGVRMLGEVPALGTSWSGLDTRRLPKSLARVADGVLAGLGTQDEPLGTAGASSAWRGRR